MVKCIDILKFLGFYWRTVIIVLTPLVFLPIVILDNIKAKRCFYCVLVMSIYWMFEVFPLGITGLMPIFLFPLFGIMDSDSVCTAYMKDTTVMFIGGLFIALTIEYSRLHTRIALYTIALVGCSPRRLMIGIMTITCLISMWIVNTAATAMMIPIVQAILEQLEEQGFGQMYHPREAEPGKTLPPINEDDNRKPTRLTICMFFCTAISSSIGGIGTLVGTGTNMTFKGIFEESYPDYPGGIDFLKWMQIGMPLALVTNIFIMIYLMIFYMGLFRPNSADAKATNIGREGIELSRGIIREKIKDLGNMSFHEGGVLVIFVICILLWMLRSPNIFPGWADVVTTISVKDSAAAMFGTFVFFIIPAVPSFIHFFSEDPDKRPKKPSEGLVTWKALNSKMPWGLAFLIGGGLALSDAVNKSGMGDMVAGWLSFLKLVPRIGVLFIGTLFASFATQIISSNVAVANILLPIYASTCQGVEIHPIYIMMPAAIACSFAFCLPISTPPNAIAAAPINMSTLDMIKVGIGAAIIGGFTIVLCYLSYATIFEDFSKFPDWAKR